jgi:hypothetical protein
MFQAKNPDWILKNHPWQRRAAALIAYRLHMVAARIQWVAARLWLWAHEGV